MVWEGCGGSVPELLSAASAGDSSGSGGQVPLPALAGTGVALEPPVPLPPPDRQGTVVTAAAAGREGRTGGRDPCCGKDKKRGAKSCRMEGTEFLPFVD